MLTYIYMYIYSVTAHLETVYFRLQRECLVREPLASLSTVLIDTGVSVYLCMCVYVWVCACVCVRLRVYVCVCGL